MRRMRTTRPAHGTCSYRSLMARGRGRRRSRREGRQHQRHHADGVGRRFHHLPHTFAGWALAGTVSLVGLGAVASAVNGPQTVPTLTTAPAAVTSTRAPFPPTPGTRPAATTTATTQARTTPATRPPATSPPITRPPATPTSRFSIPTTALSPGYPANATAECTDGTISYSAHRSGTCSHHGGVAHWINRPPS